MAQLTISKARQEFLDLPERLAREPKRAVIITRRGQPVLAVLPWELYESIVGTLEVVSDKRGQRSMYGRAGQLAHSPEDHL